MVTGVQLEANIVRHCNNRCAACSHGAPFAPPRFMAADQLERDLARLSPILHVGRFCIVGGEPLLHPELLRIIDVSKQARVADEVAVVTNGRLLDRMDDGFWKRLELLLISVYPNLDRRQLELAQDRALQHGFRLIATETSEFYVQFAHKPDGSSFRTCPWKHILTVDTGHLFLCPPSALWPGRFMGLPESIDGLPLAEVDEQRLRVFIGRSQPFRTCSICEDFTAKIPWHECATELEWLRASTHPRPETDRP